LLELNGLILGHIIN